MLRSAAFIAAKAAGLSAPAVSMIAKVKLFFSSAARVAGRRPGATALTGTSSEPRVLAQLTSEACGSRSMTKTRSPASLAATASEDARVLLPSRPFA